MEIKSRETYSFVELKVGEVEVSVFKGENAIIFEMINNLQDIIDILETYKTSET